MWYIRFLKVPEYKVSAPQSKDRLKRLMVTFTISITTDLGDEFLTGDKSSDHALLLTAIIVKAELGDSSLKWKSLESAKSHFSWESGKRSITHKFEVPLQGNIPISSLRLVISPKDEDANLQNVISGQIPRVINIWSDVFDSKSGKSTSGRVQRRFPLDHERFLHVWEETGESIARHIWWVMARFFLTFLIPSLRDAGIATWLYVLESAAPNGNKRELSKVLESVPKEMKILELGSGCGIGGLAFAMIIPDDRLSRSCKVVMTDLLEAMPILQHNVNQNNYAQGCTVDIQVLDWEDEDSRASLLVKWSFDIVLVSDCTYNCDSSPALVRTLSALAKASNPYIIVALKVRHESEGIFFTLMEEAGFGTLKDGRFVDDFHEEVLLPHYHGDCPAGESVQKIDIYTFRIRNN